MSDRKLAPHFNLFNTSFLVTNKRRSNSPTLTVLSLDIFILSKNNWSIGIELFNITFGISRGL